ncbi:cyclin-A2-like, partial [Haematococcus lacustris]
FVSQALLPGGHRFTALLGVTCLWTASKYEEVQSPTASEMVNIIADSYSVHQLLALEVSLLHGLHWELSHPTPLAFLHLYLQAMQVAPGALSCLADCLLELSLLDVGGSAVQQGSAALQPSRIAALALSTALTRAGQPERVSSVMQLAAWDNQHCIAHLAQALLQEFDHRQACLAQNQYCPIMARYANAQLRLDLAASALQPVARSTRSHAVSYPPSLGSNPSPQHHALLPEAAPQQKQQVVTSQQCMARGQEQCTRPEPSHLAVQPHLPAGPWSSCCPEPSSIPNSAREPAKTIRLQRWLSQAAEQQDQQHWQHQQDQQQECENDLDLPEPW